ncbi:MAG: serine/threonine protein kinase [Planctomycetota bacterium]|nr:MAG: serine/threonine protein kinase [Planctomycetota bacterium]
MSAGTTGGPQPADEPPGEPDPLAEHVLAAAVRSGLVESEQATQLADSFARFAVGSDPDHTTATAAERTASLLVEQGLLDEEAAATLAEEVSTSFLPGYRLLRELGRGAMGVVYEAVQEKLQRRVALKVINPRLSADRAYLARFRREALTLARLNHPNIVTVYDYGEVEGKVYLALEYVDGVDGAEAVRERGPFPEEEALRVVRDAALGLSHAHRHGVVHRDVKPANLMLVAGAGDAGGARTITKVMDFGLARDVEPGPGKAELTQAGTILGSPAYMAPEQTEGKPADVRSDLYALGATLYHLLTGRAPFASSSVLDVLVKKRTGRLPDPRKKTPHFGRGVVLLLDRMLARDPAHRYASYEALLADLDAVAAGGLPAEGPVPRESSSLDLDPASPSGAQERPRAAEAAAPGEGTGPAGADAATSPALADRRAEPSAAKPPAPSPQPAAGGSALPYLLCAGVLLALAVGAWAWRGPRRTASGPDLPPPLAGDPEAGVSSRAEGAAGAPDARTLARLDATAAGFLAEAQSLHRGGEYAALGKAVGDRLALYDLAGRAPPAELLALARVAEAAAREGRGAEERRVWARARASEDPVERRRLLADFRARFGDFSPVVEEAEELLAAAAREAPTVSVATTPRDARLWIDGKEVGTGGWEGPLRRGEHRLRAEAAGYLPTRLRLQVNGSLHHELILGPRRRHPLRPGLRQRPVFRADKFFVQWRSTGSWKAILEEAGVLGEAAGEPAVTSRDLRPLVRGMDAGWSLSWELLAEPRRTESGSWAPSTESAAEKTALEVRLLARSGGAAVLRCEGRRLRLGVLRGADFLPRNEVERPRPPRHLRVAYDGDLLTLHADEKEAPLASLRPDWRAEGEQVEFRVLAGRVLLRNFRLVELVSAEPGGR